MNTTASRLFVGLVCTAAMVATSTPVDATPIVSGNLAVSATMTPGSAGSPYNPRSVGGNNYIGQLTPNLTRYPAGSSVADIATVAGAEHRMTAPFRGASATTYLLAAGGAANDNFTRLDYATFGGAVTAAYLNPAGHTDTEPNSFGWVDDDTIIFGAYENSSGVGGANGRLTLHLADVVANPFSVTKNTAWNANGAVLTSASGRIRNVSVGDVYGGHAYYGSAGAASASFYALNLATGVETTLGTTTVTGSGSWGLWTVKESDGYLYVHTTDDGIQVYNMADATTLGSLFTTHSQAQLEALSGNGPQQSWGFDVVDDGARMLYTNGSGTVLELVAVPEPVTAVLLGLGSLALLALRRLGIGA